MLHLHRAERADVLAGALGELLAEAVSDPFAAEVVCVPSRGVERWITQQLALVLGARGGGFDGVCANVEFPSPGRLVADVVAEVSGIEARSDPWRPGRSVWPVLELIETGGASLGPVFEQPPAAGAPQGRFRRYAAARHIAELFDSYATYRPSMITAWAGGSDTDGFGEVLPDDLLWQPELWRRLRALLALPSFAERLAPAADLLRSAGQEVLPEVPERFSLFGITRLPPSQLEVFAALAAARDVHLWLLHPAPALWEQIKESGTGRPVRRRKDPTAELVRHRLLSSLGRDARELQLTLADAAAPMTDTHHPLPPDGGRGGYVSALKRLQDALRSDTSDAEPSVLDPGDRSIQVHACHGRARQVEVVRDVILGLLAADPSLEPRDIVVMCPDIETYAPLISATFGVGAEPSPDAGDPPSALVSPARLLRVRLADRSLRQTNPVMSVAASLLELVDGRMTASDVLDFAAAPPVRKRFRFDDDALSRITEWVVESQVRWGLDAEHRSAFALEAFPQNTWESGLDRLLLGVTMAEGPAGGESDAGSAASGWLGLALPLDDVDSSDIELAGTLAELVERLRAAVGRLAGPQSLSAWITALGEAIESLTLTAPSDSWQSAQLRSELRYIVEAAGERADDVTLTLADLRALMAERLRGRPTRANFRTGSLTMCTLVPMRSVPHRVVCLLGLDDGAFPRHPSIDGDNVLLSNPMTGERDERSEDRQLLLDALLAAKDQLVVTYAGADERTNALRPPAVPVGELLDTVDAAFALPDGQPARARIVTRHPLQPFDPKNFAAGRLGVPEPFSFDPVALGGARALLAPRIPPPPFLTERLPAPPDEDLVDLEALRMFFDHPARGFLRQRLGAGLLRDEDETSDRLPIELDHLARWGLGQRMLEARLSGLDAAHCRQVEWRRGALPPGRLGARVLDDVAAEVESVVAEVQSWCAEPARTLDLIATLPEGRRLSGTVPGVHGATLVISNFGKVNAKRRFRTWLTYLLLAAAHPGEEFRGVLVGRQGSVPLGPIGSEVACRWLADLGAASRARPARAATDRPEDVLRIRQRAAQGRCRRGGAEGRGAILGEPWPVSGGEPGAGPRADLRARAGDRRAGRCRAGSR